MKRGLRWLGIGLGALVGLVLLLALILFAVGSWKLGRSYDVETANLTIPTDTGAIARGGHVARIHGCTDCHGPSLSGQVFADEPPFRAVASNLTRGAGGVGGNYDARTFDRAIRHGIRYDGRSLFIMPSAAFHNLGDEDAANLIAYLLTLPPVDNELPPTEFRVLGRVLAAFAIDPTLEVGTAPARSGAPPPSASPEYGEYLTSITCAYCHGQDLRGAQPPNPDSPRSADLTIAGNWSFEEFDRALRTGITPSGRALDPEIMPWSFTALMSNDELNAIHAYLATIDASSSPTAGR